MYAVAARLDPDTYLALARATYREMAAAGITCVGEFHYVHHQPGRLALRRPQRDGRSRWSRRPGEAGLRITLLDTLYLSSGFGVPPEGAQLRYSDGSVGALGRRGSTPWTPTCPPPRTPSPAWRSTPSARCRPTTCRRWPHALDGRPFHVHLSEQVAENDACLEAYGVTPDAAARRPRPAGPDVEPGARHPPDRRRHRADRRSRRLRALLPDDRARPRRRHRAEPSAARRGRPPDPRLRQPRGDRPVRGDARASSSTSGWPPSSAATGPPPSCSTAATTTGHGSLGWDDAGAIAVGRRADLVVVDPASPRTAGAGRDEGAVVFAASAEDVSA